MLDKGRDRTRSKVGDAGDTGIMQISSRLFHGDVELGKKDDDRKPTRHPQWMLWRPIRYRKRRLLITILGCYLFWVLFNSLPGYLGGIAPEPLSESDSDAASSQYSSPSRYSTPSRDTSFSRAGRRVSQTEPEGPPPIPSPSSEVGDDKKKFFFDGEIKFYKFAISLQQASTTMGYRYINRNVVFAASDLRSASTMIAMACEMSKWDRNFVHLVITGRDNLPMDDIFEVNGVDEDSCHIQWHDARPDYTEYSTDERAEDSVKSAVGHMYSYLHPQVIITDDPKNEDDFFTKGIEIKCAHLDIPVIQIPKGASDKLMWITRLDAGSLKAWHRPSVDILISTPGKFSGSLLRLLRSLYAADYSGIKPPRLIIDLPPKMDSLTKQFMETFAWPPRKVASQTSAESQLILHHRIPSRRASPEEASARFLESFYPTQPTDSHVLVLSAQAELSPQFYHYIKYNILEYLYSSHSGGDSSRLFGISLERPSKYLNGTTEFEAPPANEMLKSEFKIPSGKGNVPFLWDAPSNNAALYLGSKWIEMHSFLTYRFATQEEKSRKPEKLISQSWPAWTEYALEFMRTRGYYILYPGSATGESMVTVHNELAQIPEEFDTRLKKNDAPQDQAPSEIPEDGVLHAMPNQAIPPRSEFPTAQSSRALHEILPFAAELPQLSYLPHLSFDGANIDFRESVTLQRSYATKFREDTGGCEPLPEGIKRKFVAGSAQDLFCFGDETEDDYEEDFESPLPVVQRSRFGMPFEQNSWSAITKKIGDDEITKSNAGLWKDADSASTSDEVESVSQPIIAAATYTDSI